jgi:hypothetical protein
MRAGNSQRCLTAVAHSLGNAGKEKRPAGDGFQMLVGSANRTNRFHQL